MEQIFTKSKIPIKNILEKWESVKDYSRSNMQDFFKHLYSSLESTDIVEDSNTENEEITAMQVICYNECLKQISQGNIYNSIHELLEFLGDYCNGIKGNMNSQEFYMSKLLCEKIVQIIF